MADEPKTLKEALAQALQGCTMVKMIEINNIPFTKRKPDQVSLPITVPLLMLNACLKQRSVLKYTEKRETKGGITVFVVEFYSVYLANSSTYTFNRLEVPLDVIHNSVFVEFMQQLQEKAIFND
jgi:hypothetical protein